MFPNISSIRSTSKDSLTKKTEVGKDSRTNFLGFTLGNLVANLIIITFQFSKPARSTLKYFWPIRGTSENGDFQIDHRRSPSSLS